MTLTQDVQLVGVVKENRLDVVLYDAAGKSRTFSCPPAQGAARLRFKPRGKEDDTSLTPCFTQDGYHQFSGSIRCSVCAVETPHVHAHFLDLETFEEEGVTLHPVPNSPEDDQEEEEEEAPTEEQEEENPAGENTPLLQSANKKKKSKRRHYVYKIQVRWSHIETAETCPVLTFSLQYFTIL